MALSHALLFSLLVLTISALTINAASYSSPSPAPSPAHHHHPGHGHHHRHPQSQPPTPPPAQPPTTYPSKPPTPPPATPPSPPPAKPPTTPPPSYPPVKPPTPSPAKPPSTPSYPRKLVAIQGVVYCKNCTYAGIDTLLGASPLEGAKVEVRCRNTRYLIKGTATTDKNGYFFLKAPPLITTYGVRKCRAYLPKKPKQGGACGKATNLNGGVTGGLLIPDKSLFQSNNQSKPAHPGYAVFNVGPFAYEPIKCDKH